MTTLYSAMNFFSGAEETETGGLHVFFKIPLPIEVIPLDWTERRHQTSAQTTVQLLTHCGPWSSGWNLSEPGIRYDDRTLLYQWSAMDAC